jgi:hypothetical protein
MLKIPKVTYSSGDLFSEPILGYSILTIQFEVLLLFR